MSKLSDEKILELAHRRATKYTHRTTPGEAAYGFTAQHLIDFVRHDIEAAVRAELAETTVSLGVGKFFCTLATTPVTI